MVLSAYLSLIVYYIFCSFTIPSPLVIHSSCLFNACLMDNSVGEALSPHCRLIMLPHFLLCFHARGPRAPACVLAVGFFHPQNLAVDRSPFSQFSPVVSVKSPQALFVLCVDHFVETQDKNNRLVLEASRVLAVAFSHCLPHPFL